MKSPLKLLTTLGSQLLRQTSKQLALYKHLHKSRKALLKLDNDFLKDIGISREQAEEEGSKPFWKGDSFESKQENRSEQKIQGCLKVSR